MESLILRAEPFRDDDMTVTLLSRDGRRLETYARSARAVASRLRTGIQPVSVSDVTLVPGRSQWIVRSALPILSFPMFRQSLFGLAGASVVVTVFAESGTEMPDERLYAEATRLLRDIHTAVSAREPAVLLARRIVAAWLKALAVIGLAPTFRHCAQCATKEALAALSPSEGGMVCGSCASSLEDSRALSPSALTILTDHRVPVLPGDIQQMLVFLSAFSRWHLRSPQRTFLWEQDVLMRIR